MQYMLFASLIVPLQEGQEGGWVLCPGVLIEKSNANAQQKILTSPDGRVRLQIPLVNIDQLVSFVLSWGEAARVVDPPELVDRVAETLSRALQRYSS